MLIHGPVVRVRQAMGGRKRDALFRVHTISTNAHEPEMYCENERQSRYKSEADWYQGIGGAGLRKIQPREGQTVISLF